MWALVAFALCGNPRNQFDCPAQLETYAKLSDCQGALQAFGSRMIDGRTWHLRNPHRVWCELRKENK
jgi:hypothetical protein